MALTTQASEGSVLIIRGNIHYSEWYTVLYPRLVCLFDSLFIGPVLFSALTVFIFRFNFAQRNVCKNYFLIGAII